MKKWLKSLFKANSLNEIEEEFEEGFEEKPVEEKVYQSHSIEKKRNALQERPKFRFPIELDEELPSPKPIKETKIEEPVIKQEKNADIWQKSPNNLNKEYKPTYNQSTNFVRNTFQNNHFDKSNLSSRLEKNQVTKSEEEPAKVEKEEKVDIVFRPKRKTPFRPSEYISPIYGYQKPPIKEENATDSILSSTNEEMRVEASQINNVLEKVETNSFEIGSFGNQNQEIIEGLNLVENEKLQTEAIQIENEELQAKYYQNVEDTLNVEEVQFETHEIEVKEKNEDLKPKALQVEAEEKNEVVQLEAHQIEAEAEEKDEEEKFEIHQIEAEAKVMDEEVQLETLKIKAEDEVESEEVQHEVNIYRLDLVSIKEEKENDYHAHIKLNVEDIIEKNESNEHKAETLVQLDENEDKGIELVQNNEEYEVESELTVELDGVIEEIKEEVVQHESSTVESKVEESAEINQNSVANSNEQTEIEADKEESEPKPMEKRQKKRHFPFNVMMLRSDVEASRKANIMRQLRELQNESAATVEKVNEEVEIKQNEQLIENASLSEQSEILSSEKVQPSEIIAEAITYENPPEGIQDQPVLETVESITETDITIETKNEIVQTDEPQSLDEQPPVLYELPELDLLVEPPIEQFNDGDWVEDQKQLLQETLHNFNVGARVIAATQGPTVTRFEVQPEPGVKVNKITNLQDDIKLSLAARDIRIEAPIPGRSAIGIEVPNKESKPVYLRELVSQDKFLQSESPLTVALGLDIGGDPVYADISKMPHGLIAGATGSGKSVCINSILVSILYKAKPHEVKLILIDPKMVELAPYNHIPHLISPVITDARAATAALKWACDEMDRRYDLFAHAGARDIKRFNDLAKKKGAYNDELPYLVIIIDELADLMMVSPGDVETYICRIAQKARACGIHLLVATQRPSVDVITGIIKSNIPTRIAFTVSSQVDSRTIIDIGGAEKLLGRGDMLFLDNGKSQAIRLQGVYVSDDEIEHVVEIVKDQQKPNYLFNQEELVAKADAQDVDDELFQEAVEFVIDQKGASVSMLQRRFRIGYNRAARLIDLMFDHGIVSNQNGSKPRDVLITSLEEFRSE
ncbi:MULTISPECIES: DNA translocase FtsK [unclassified Bacillus (in: firmicutes)]|uniref:DNA translocase FtsK n=1 Tax=unclassified Bacillus (in: firmicutes) TaxID=185979 RepID=UPI0008DFB687|nr:MULTISPECIES: DNA translocase FtsK [unclassified Bacillus (in: firmicutes)]PGZ90683.1 DNA translocase FtsK [Bacillus sp. AFS029533]SFD29873.1 DNA segregation ATPase FtsK/SpoIIIE, S-DNA-T family [Bacillus sp. UNCCL81]